MELELQQGGLAGIKTIFLLFFWPIFEISKNSNHRQPVIRTDCDKLISPPVQKLTVMIMSSPTTAYCRGRNATVMEVTTWL
jgi:thioredoxin-related protein